jgi:hypothetical protein
MSTDVTDEPWWWVSFQDMAKPKGQRFLACAIVRGKSRQHLLERMKRYGLVPKAIALHAEPRQIARELEYLIEDEPKYRLMDREESVACSDRINAAFKSD